MALITETNAQYYSGQQAFDSLSNVTNPTFTCTFNTNIISAFNSSSAQVASRSNYTIYLDNVKVDESLSFVSNPSTNTVTLLGTYTASIVYIQLKQFAVEDNYGSYSYISLDDVINNFLVAYVGDDKLIRSVKRTDVLFHAKRGLQEFSFDTLKSINSQELTVPPSLSVAIPQDYVNYVTLSRIDESGVKRIIYPVNNLTTSPTGLPLQDSDGLPSQNSFGENNEAEQSITEGRWNSETQRDITGELNNDETNVYDWSWWKLNFGQRYGMDPQTSQSNGWFQINEREGKFSFSSDLANQLIVIEYISDGLAYDTDSKVPKMAEDALYAHINYSILSTRPNIPEYIVQRYKRERFAKLRNAKIRLSNLKLNEIVQVFRGKSKWLKF